MYGTCRGLHKAVDSVYGQNSLASQAFETKFLRYCIIIEKESGEDEQAEGTATQRTSMKGIFR